MELTSNIESLNAALEEYARMRGKSASEVLAAKGAQLMFTLSARLKLLAPHGGQATYEAVGLLGPGGRGVKPRPSIVAKFRGKPTIGRKAWTQRNNRRLNQSLNDGTRGVNWWAQAVAREVAVRESAGGYLSYAARGNNIARMRGTSSLIHTGRMGQVLKNVDMGETDIGAVMRVAFDGRTKLGQGLRTPRAQQAIADSLAEVEADTRQYFIDHEKRQIERALAKHLRQ